MNTPAETDGRRSAAAARRRAREKEILAATRALFDERGVRDAQIEDIARAVGINRAIVYRHFTGKEELFALTLVGYLDELRTALADAAAGHEDARDRLEAIVGAFVDYGLAYPAFIDCAQTLMRRRGPELLDEMSTGDSRIRVIRQRNAGPSAARNAATFTCAKMLVCAMAGATPPK